MSEIELHRKLLGDAPRNQAFHAALRHYIRPASTVLDIGAGTGFLSFLARRLGAKHSTLIEYADTIELAETLARRNGIDGLSFIRGHSMELQRKLSVDIVVTETLGNFALEEGFLETAVDARRFLKRGGTILPYGLSQYVAPVTTRRLQDDIDIWSTVGFDLDLAPAREISLNNMYVKAIRPDDLAAPTTVQCWDELDLRPDRPAPSSKRSKTLRWKGSDIGASTVEGFALWWHTDLAPDVRLSTSPFDPPTHWEQIYLPLLKPLTIKTDDQIELTLTCDTRPDVGVRLVWQTTLKRAGKVVVDQRQDSLKGRL